MEGKHRRETWEPPTPQLGKAMRERQDKNTKQDPKPPKDKK